MLKLKITEWYYDFEINHPGIIDESEYTYWDSDFGKREWDEQLRDKIVVPYMIEYLNEGRHIFELINEEYILDEKHINKLRQLIIDYIKK